MWITWQINVFMMMKARWPKGVWWIKQSGVTSQAFILVDNWQFRGERKERERVELSFLRRSKAGGQKKKWRKWKLLLVLVFVPGLQIPEGGVVTGPWIGRFRCRHKCVVLHVLLSVAYQTDTQANTCTTLGQRHSHIPAIYPMRSIFPTFTW